MRMNFAICLFLLAGQVIVAGRTTCYAQNVVLPPDTVISQTLYTYDTHGNNVTVQADHGTTTYTYDGVGRVLTSVGPNTETATYQYNQCGTLLPSSYSVKTPSGALTATATWNCASETIATYVDPNTNPWSVGYGSDPMWRPVSVNDPMGNITTYTYTATTTDARLLVTASSVKEHLSTLDSTGRPHLEQDRQGPNNTAYNTVETDYDVNGRVSRVTVPFSAAAGATNATVAAKTLAYDGADRITLTSYPLGTKQTTSYNGADVLVAITPAPSGENSKSKQYEFNGLGWLMSVCEVTGMAGSYSCGQANAANGFLTTYSYGPTGKVTGIVQNAGGTTKQTRSFTYEGNNWGRLYRTTTPEAGTVSVMYDSDPSGVCPVPFMGFPVSITDNSGAVTCLTYDVADRLTGQSFPQGLNSSVTPTRTFIYDASTNANINCANKNQAGALAETITGPAGAPLTDEGFCYDANGRATDTFSHVAGGSSGYTHISESYFANGVINQLSLPGQPVIAYQLDPMARVKSASGGTQNPLTSTTYNAAGLATGITLGSGDTTSYTWNNGVGPMASSTFKVGASTITHALTWYPNGSLKQLVITDPVDTSDSQTCTFSYDDLRRSKTDNCGTAWNESFSYDPFGNVTKSGSMPWPLSGGYNQANNQYSSSAYSYDANGRLTNDSFDSLSWDVQGNLVRQSGTSFTYDALNRPVMAGAAQYIYAPDGGLVGIQNGSGSITKMLVTLPMGQAVYTGGTSPSYYNRVDWQGSVRVASTASQTPYAITAYDAFGIPYASQGATDFQYAGLTSDISSGTERVSGTRRYHPTQGRWMSPDSTIPDPTEPQTFNAYHYALNMPTSAVDPGGNDDSGCCALSFNGYDYFSSYEMAWEAFIDEMSREATARAQAMWQSTEVGGALYPEMIEEQMAQIDLHGRVGPTMAPGMIAYVNVNTPANPPSSSDTFAEGSLAAGVFHSPIWKSAANTMNMATAVYAGTFAGILAAPEAAAAVGVARTGITAASGTVAYYTGYAQAALAGSGGVLLGKYISSTENYMLDAQEMGVGYFNLGKAYSIFNNFGLARIANQGFIDAAVQRGPIYLGSFPINQTGSYAWELQYLFSLSIRSAQIVPAWRY